MADPNPYDREADGVLWLKAEVDRRDAECREMGGCTPACRARLRKELRHA